MATRHAPTDGALRSRVPMQRVLDNSRSGERIVIRRSAAETDGRLLEFDVFLQPGAHVPAGHVHPNQQEQFTVLSGWVRFRLEGRTCLVGPGARLTVPSRRSHWFGNAGGDVAQLRVEVRPALRMEELFATTVRCANAGTSSRILRLLDWLLIPRDFEREVNIPRVPANLVSALLGPVAWLRRGLRAPA